MKLREVILRERNKAVTPESISNWFRRHADVREELEKEVVEEELPQEEVQGTIFVNGTFEHLETVDKWIRDMRRRHLAPETMRRRVGTLKNVCKGEFPKLGIELSEYGWAYKHPDRLDLNDCIKQMDLMLEHHAESNTSHLRDAMRSFLTSKRIVVGTEISGAKSKGAGKMADMFVEKPVLYEILNWIRSLNFEAYVCDNLMFKTAGRITATITALLDNLRVEGDYIELKIFDKGRRSKYPEGHPWNKYISPGLFKEICELTGYPERKTGPIFSISAEEMGKLNRAALEKFCPYIIAKYPYVMPNHFWRHMFAQHMLRITKWNYAAVAALGGWTVKALEESYGKPPRATIREWGLDHVPSL